MSTMFIFLTVPKYSGVIKMFKNNSILDQQFLYLAIKVADNRYAQYIMTDRLNTSKLTKMNLVTDLGN